MAFVCKFEKKSGLNCEKEYIERIQSDMTCHLPGLCEMRIVSHLIAALLLTLSLSNVVKSQSGAVPAKSSTVVQTSGESVENGIFKSVSGKFSIAIPDLPKQTLDMATEKAKANGIDVGRQFIWVYEKTLYTLYYNPAFDFDGNPSPQVYADIENGTRKGILNSQARLISENPIKLGSYRGTEFRYVGSNGVRYINRVFLVGDMGYQIVGGYADEKDEQAVIAVLDSFKPTKP